MKRLLAGLLLTVATLSLAIPSIVSPSIAVADDGGAVSSVPAYAIIEKSGCGEYNGNVKVRMDFYLTPDAPRYPDMYLYLIDLYSPEYLLGYEGKVDKDGNPINQSDYDHWYDSLPRIWQNTPFHSHFVYFSPDVTDEEIEAELNYHLPNFYTAFQNYRDVEKGGMRHGWATEKRIEPVDYSNATDYNIRKALAEDRVDSLTRLTSELVYLEGQEYPATEIDIGATAIGRGWDWGDGYTFIALDNTANDTGTIDTFELWADTTMDGTNKVGTFYYAGADDDWTNRDGDTIGNVVSGAKRTFSGLDIDVTTGDSAGLYVQQGTIEMEQNTGGGMKWYPGDFFGTTHTYLLQATRSMSVYGTGETAGPAAPTVTSAAADDIGETTADGHGEITVTGGENADERGFVWDLATQGAPGNVAPAASGYANNWTEAGDFGVGVFDHTFTGLPPNDTIYWRACAHNSGGWSYSAERNFNTLLPLPLPPTSFTATQTGTNSITLDWVTGVGADTTTIRAKEESYPVDRTDGFEVYDGALETLDIDGLNLGTSTYYYRAWSENVTGYSTDTADTNIGGENMLFLGLLFGAIALTAIGYTKGNVPVVYGGAGIWAVFAGYSHGQAASIALNTGTWDTYGMLFWIAIAMVIVCMLEPKIRARVTGLAEDTAIALDEEGEANADFDKLLEDRKAQRERLDKFHSSRPKRRRRSKFSSVTGKAIF